MAAAIDLRDVAPPSAEQEALRERVTLRQDLITQRVAMEERVKATATADLKAPLENLLMISTTALAFSDFLRFRSSRTLKYDPVRFSKNRKNPVP